MSSLASFTTVYGPTKGEDLYYQQRQVARAGLRVAEAEQALAGAKHNLAEARQQFEDIKRRPKS